MAAPSRADDVKASVEMLISEQSRVDRYTELDFARQDLMYHQTSTILAVYGGYNSYLKADGSPANGSDITRFRNRVEDYVPAALVDFRRKTGRDKSLVPEEAQLSGSAGSLLEEMLAAAGEIVALCDAGKPYEASLVYRDRSMPLNAELLGVLYTLRKTSSDRFGKAAMKAKYQ